jgi:hypothetical protein
MSGCYGCISGISGMYACSYVCVCVYNKTCVYRHRGDGVVRVRARSLAPRVIRVVHPSRKISHLPRQYPQKTPGRCMRARRPGSGRHREPSYRPAHTSASRGDRRAARPWFEYACTHVSVKISVFKLNRARQRVPVTFLHM